MSFIACAAESINSGISVLNNSQKAKTNQHKIIVFNVNTTNKRFNLAVLSLLLAMLVILVYITTLLTEITQAMAPNNNPLQSTISNYTYDDEVDSKQDLEEYYDNCTSIWISPDMMSSQVAPVILRMSNFSEKLEHNEWYSDPFFAFEGGYKVCLRVDADGYGDHKGTHVFGGLFLMEGPHDYDLEKSGQWPMNGAFTVELLNQLYDVVHQQEVFFISNETCSACTKRVLKDVMAKGYGDDLISHQHLDYDGYHISYKKDGNLYFRVSYSSSFSYTYLWSMVMPNSLILIMTCLLDSTFTFTILLIIEIVRGLIKKSKYDIKLQLVLVKWMVLEDLFSTIVDLELITLIGMSYVLLWEFGVISYSILYMLLRMSSILVFVLALFKVIRKYSLSHTNNSTIMISLPWIMYVLETLSNYGHDIVNVTVNFGLYLCCTLLLNLIMYIIYEFS